MVQYYTLEEAAKVLQTSPDKLREMANRKEVRAFQDRGSLRFRAAEIDELARARGLGSDAEVQFGEAAKGPSASRSPSPTPKSPTPTPKSPSPTPKSPSPTPKKKDSSVKLVLDSELDFNIDEGSKQGGSKSSGVRPPGKTPSSTTRKTKPVDSGVRMVGQEQASDSDVKLPQEADEVQLAP